MTKNETIKILDMLVENLTKQNEFHEEINKKIATCFIFENQILLYMNVDKICETLGVEYKKEVYSDTHIIRSFMYKGVVFFDLIKIADLWEEFENAKSKAETSSTAQE